MIKDYKDYIREQQHLDVDPFDEEDWDIDNLSPLFQIIRKKFGNKPYDEITKLDGYNKELTSLEGIENLVNLKILFCGHNQLNSLDGVENLVNLEKLYCYHNHLTSLEEIENLVNLKELFLSVNQLTSLEEIENLVNLKTLFCDNNQLTSL